MAENDIYDSRAKYERLLAKLDQLGMTPAERRAKGFKNATKAKHHCKNKQNLAYFRKLATKFEALDLSYIRRMRLLQSFKIVVSATEKDLKDCNRDDIDGIVAYMHKCYESPKSKSDFLRDIKYIWKLTLPEKDERGRIDESITPYPVRQLSARIDKSREKRRNDKLEWEEYEQIVSYFQQNPMMQAYLTLANESLGRPQEMLYCKIGDVEMHDNYAKVWISSHGKEGVKFLQCIDSYQYLATWLNMHPNKHNKAAFLFSTDGKQTQPKTINLHLKQACIDLGIDKPITAYSLKRCGVTFRRIRGDSDLEIQHAARWTSTKQLKTYDLSTADDSFKRALIRAGKIKGELKYADLRPKAKPCLICGHQNKWTDSVCSNCMRPLDRKELAKMEQGDDVVHKLIAELVKVPALREGMLKIMEEAKLGEKLEQL